MSYIKPRIPEKEIELCLEMFDKEEAKKRICRFIEDTINDAEQQYNNCGITVLFMLNRLIAIEDSKFKEKYIEAKQNLSV